MKKGQPKPVKQLPISPLEEAIFFRLCHVCHHLNESQAEIYQCKKCHRMLTVEPYWGAIEHKLVLGEGQEQAAAEESGDGHWENEGFASLTGLSVIW